MSQREADWTGAFLKQMGDQADGPADQRHAFECQQGEPDVEQNCGDRPRDVQNERTSVNRCRGLSDRAHRRDMIAGGSKFVGQTQKAGGPGIFFSVERMSEARQWDAFLAQSGNAEGGCFPERHVGYLGLGDDFGKQPASNF